MKGILLTLLTMSSLILNSYSQRCVYSNDSIINIHFDFDLGKFEIYNLWPSLEDEIDSFESELFLSGHSSPLVISELFSEGTVVKKNNVISCYDPKLDRIYRFEVIDQYTIQSIKSTAIFKNGELLKITSKIDKSKNIHMNMTWKDGKKNSIWRTWLNDSILKMVLYKQGEAIDSMYFNRYNQ